MTGGIEKERRGTGRRTQINPILFFFGNVITYLNMWTFCPGIWNSGAVIVCVG